VLGRLWNALSSYRLDRRAATDCVALLALLATLFYGGFLHGIYPLRLWLLWQLAMLWGWVALFSLACASFGQLVLVRLCKLTDLPALEAAVLGMAVGVVAFTLAMYVGGACAWYGPTFAVLLPLAMLAAGAKHGWRVLRALWSELAEPRPGGLLAIALGAAGVACVGLIYLGAMTPYALNYDSTWSHLVIAQEYARAGRIVPFLGDYNKNVPHLASMLFTWGWLVPGLEHRALRWMMALHLEVGLFLWTLAAIAACVRALVGDPKLRGAWLGLFLFPIIFVYDDNLGGSSDHVCGFFSVPIALATLRLCTRFSLGAAALVAIVCAGDLLTKLQAAYLLIPTALLIAGYWLKHLTEHALLRLAKGQAPERGPAQVPLRTLLWAPWVIAGLGLLLFSPHCIRQLVFHKNPLYPFLQDVFTSSTPTVGNASAMIGRQLIDPKFTPTGAPTDRLWHACKLFFTFSFKPHYSFTKDVPSFGSLFTLLLPAIVFVPDRRRLLLVTALGSGALLAWGVLYNVDRNLQTFMPVLVCATTAILVKAWRLGPLARVGLVPLVALQIAWGGDAFFYTSHGRINDAMNLIRSGFEDHAKTRFDGYRSEFVAIGKAVPKNARILLHKSHVTLGIEREIVLDWAGFQGLIDYRGLHTPRELYDYYRSLHITHLLVEGDMPRADSKAEEVLWQAFITRHAVSAGQFGGHRLFRMPALPPPVEPSYRVAIVGVEPDVDGIYPIERLASLDCLPHPRRSHKALETWSDEATRLAGLGRVDAVFMSWALVKQPKFKSILRKDFVHVFDAPDEWRLYLRKPQPAAPQ
jgi:hypothetical protein